MPRMNIVFRQDGDSSSSCCSDSSSDSSSDESSTGSPTVWHRARRVTVYPAVPAACNHCLHERYLACLSRDHPACDCRSGRCANPRHRSHRAPPPPQVQAARRQREAAAAAAAAAADARRQRAEEVQRARQQARRNGGGQQQQPVAAAWAEVSIHIPRRAAAAVGDIEAALASAMGDQSLRRRHSHHHRRRPHRHRDNGDGAASSAQAPDLVRVELPPLPAAAEGASWSTRINPQFWSGRGAAAAVFYSCSRVLMERNLTNVVNGAIPPHAVAFVPTRWLRYYEATPEQQQLPPMTTTPPQHLDFDEDAELADAMLGLYATPPLPQPRQRPSSRGQSIAVSLHHLFRRLEMASLLLAAEEETALSRATRRRGTDNNNNTTTPAEEYRPLGLDAAIRRQLEQQSAAGATDRLLLPPLLPFDDGYYYPTSADLAPPTYDNPFPAAPPASDALRQAVDLVYHLCLACHQDWGLGCGAELLDELGGAVLDLIRPARRCPGGGGGGGADNAEVAQLLGLVARDDDDDYGDDDVAGLADWPRLAPAPAAADCSRAVDLVLAYSYVFTPPGRTAAATTTTAAAAAAAAAARQLDVLRRAWEALDARDRAVVLGVLEVQARAQAEGERERRGGGGISSGGLGSGAAPPTEEAARAADARAGARDRGRQGGARERERRRAPDAGSVPGAGGRPSHARYMAGLLASL